MILQSSQSFGKTLSDKSDAEYRRLRDNYDNFLELPPHPSQFVAMDDDGNVLEEPKPEDYFPTDKPSDQFTEEDKISFNSYYSPMMNFEQSQSKVLFDGFEKAIGTTKVFTNYDGCIIMVHENNKFSVSGKEVKTISDLILYNLTLTANAKQIIGV